MSVWLGGIHLYAPFTWGVCWIIELTGDLLELDLPFTR